MNASLGPGVRASVADVAGDLELWCVPLDGCPLLHAVLDARERARADRLRDAGERRRFVAAHGVLRALLGRRLGVPPAAVILEVDGRGKPYVAGGTPAFSMARSGGWALYALSSGPPVGVDLEHSRSGIAAERIAVEFFTAREVAIVRAAHDRTTTFLRLWTRKEALLKATGSGIGDGLADYDASLPAPRPWVVGDLPVARGLVAAVAGVAL